MTISNPVAGTWVFLLYGTTSYSGVTLTVNCYSACDIVMTQVPANGQAIPFKAVFKGRVIDQDSAGIQKIQIKARNPLTGAITTLANTDADGYFSYSPTINVEGEHTFDFFFTSIPDTAKGTASHTVATNNSSVPQGGIFDMYEYVPATPVPTSSQADVIGLQDFLNTSNGWDDNTVDVGYRNEWIADTLCGAQTDTKLLSQLANGLNLLLYGTEGAGVGNDTSPTSALTAVPLLLHVSAAEKASIVENLYVMGVIDSAQKTAIGAGGVSVLAIATAYSADDNKDISLSVNEQIELLTDIAQNANATYQPGNDASFGDIKARMFTIDLDSGRKINVMAGAFTK
jgi:hypothetical protein